MKRLTPSNPVVRLTFDGENSGHKAHLRPSVLGARLDAHQALVEETLDDLLRMRDSPKREKEKMVNSVRRAGD